MTELWGGKRPGAGRPKSAIKTESVKPIPMVDLTDEAIRFLREQPVTVSSLSGRLSKLGTVREVRFVPGSSQASYIIPRLSLAVVVQPAMAASRVPQLISEVAKRSDVKAVVLVDSRWRLANALPTEISGRPLRLLLVGGRS